jgi:hypothetical protein
MVFLDLTTRGLAGMTTAAKTTSWPGTRPVTTAAEVVYPKRETVALMGPHRTSIPIRLDRMPLNALVAGSVSKWCGMAPWPGPAYLTGQLYTSHGAPTTGSRTLVRHRPPGEAEKLAVETVSNGVVVAVQNGLLLVRAPPRNDVDRGRLYLREVGFDP